MYGKSWYLLALYPSIDVLMFIEVANDKSIIYYQKLK